MFRENIARSKNENERERERVLYCIIDLYNTRLIFARGNLSRVKQVLFMKLLNKCVRRESSTNHEGWSEWRENVFLNYVIRLDFLLSMVNGYN